MIFGGGAIIEDGVYWEAYDYGINICRTIEDLPLKLIAKQKKVLCIGLSTSTELNNQEYTYNYKWASSWFCIKERHLEFDCVV